MNLEFARRSTERTPPVSKHLRPTQWQAYTSDPEDALRFDTKKEALAFIRNWNPRRAGVVTGAERVDR